MPCTLSCLYASHRAVPKSGHVFCVSCTLCSLWYDPVLCWIVHVGRYLQADCKSNLSLFGSQLGLALGPVVGGAVITYTIWKVIFWIQVRLTAIGLVLALILLPETSRVTELTLQRRLKSKKVWFVPYNPFRVLINIFRYSNLTLAGIISMSLHFNMNSLFTPIRYVVDPRFSLTKPLYGGLFFLAPECGYICGAFIGGRWADYQVRKYISLRGYIVPEDRLRSMTGALGLASPSVVIDYGWCIYKEKGGMAVPIVMLFLSGLAQTICYPSVNTYCVDSMLHLKEGAIASNYFVRFISAAFNSASVLPELNAIGVGLTCTISSVFLWIGFACCVALIHYGEKLRGGALCEKGR